MQQFASLPVEILAAVGLLFGLVVGSFLNVVIFRYPKMMMYQWTTQSREWLEIEAPDDEEEPPTLTRPASHCSHCKTPIKAWQNIPLISYLILRGKCGHCKTPISLRYPLVELLTGLLTATVVYYFGWSVQALFGVLLTWVLITLSFIDFDHKLLPDDIVIPMLWLGLGINVVPVFCHLPDAVIGAIAGYLSFWIVFQVFLRLTGREGMGYGDFKLMALLGAWFGWQYLPQIILISTIVGSVFGIAIMVTQKADGKLAIPFGPYIALAGWIAMIWGDDLNHFYLRFSGL